MNTLMKFLTGILGVLAVIACIATIGIICYSMTGRSFDSTEESAQLEQTPAVEETKESEDVAEAESMLTPAKTPEPVADAEYEAGHIHDYEEEVEKKATCYQTGRLEYICECGDCYFVDIPSTGHVEDGWIAERKATKEQDGLRVKRCIYCDEVVAQEVIPYETEGSGSGDEKHVHQYTGTVEREPGCVLAGLRRYSCSCGSFYTEKISALGHVASDWKVVENASATMMGREQRICNACGVVLDSRPVNALKNSSSPSASASSLASGTATPRATSSAAPMASAGASATPSSTPHSHSYTSYVLQEATCSKKGIRSFVCTCGSSYAELIELDSQNHSFKAVITPPASNASGFTTYTCVWCNYSYVDNYVSATG